MITSSVLLKNFRNYASEYAEFCSGVNVICGQNAQGKTNLLEGLYYCGATKSFRGGKDKNLKKFDQDRFEITLQFLTREREQQLFIRGGGESAREIFHNGVKKNSATQIIGLFLCVLFAPEHLSLIKNGPSERRKFIDLALSQLKPSYFTALMQYQKVLEQKSALLKQLCQGRFDEEMLTVYNQNLARFGAVIIKGRFDYLALLNQEAKKRHFDISLGKEELFVGYEPSENIQEDSPFKIEEQLKTALTQNSRREMAAGMCLVGPHRDNMEVWINGNNARLFGSQGQQRSAVLSMKLAECELVNIVTGEYPVLLLDDILSELDENRQNYIMNHIEGKQVILTCCENRLFDRIKDGKIFLIEEGQIKKV
jgi:DNA replication and repair protein RecF